MPSVESDRPDEHNQEFFLGIPGAFADLRVVAPGSLPYFVEVKYGYPLEHLRESIARKYGRESERNHGSRIILIIEPADHPESDWAETERAIRSALGNRLALEIWDHARVAALVLERFDVPLDRPISVAGLCDVREAIDRAKARFAFGPECDNDRLEAALLWHFAFWRLRGLRERRGLDKRSILAPGVYRNVAVLMADLCSFSSYVRDTSDPRVAQMCLTGFYAASRHLVINAGGMLYQFLGDAVLALFGVPGGDAGYVDAALGCARALVEIGNSVSNKWQRYIDRIQNAGGVHIGIAIGDLQIMSLRPFSRSNMGAIGDCINIAARLDTTAGPSEIVVSNTFYQRLGLPLRAGFEELGPVEAKNVGSIQAWKLSLPALARLS
ncbi:MAG TPA: adenylate/guanylate cyclase domain-containing protein [Candidatus Binatia bacterium]|nr:adenylate/guanylate cyclase domain-containing protein [Candidatus Binatia bacterium]